jgi:hypothetical protein
MQTVFNRNWPTGGYQIRPQSLHSIAVVGKLPLNPTCARPTMSAFLSDFIGGIN